MKKITRTVKQIVGQFNYILTKKQKRTCIGLFGIVLLGALLETLGVSIIMPFIEAITDPETLAKKWYIAPFVEFMNITDLSVLIVWISVAIIIFYVIKNSYLIYVAYSLARFRAGLQEELSTKMLQAYMKRPYTYFVDNNSSNIIAGIDGYIDGVYLIIENIFNIMKNLLTVFMIGAFLMFKDAFMAIGILSFVGGISVVVMFFFKNKLKDMGGDQIRARVKVQQYAYQAVNGIKDIKVLQRMDSFLNVYKQAYEEKRRIEIKKATINEVPARIIEAVCIGGIIGTVCIRASMSTDMGGFIATLGVFAVAVFKVYPAFSAVVAGVNSTVFYRYCLDNTYKNLREVEQYENYLKSYKEYNIKREEKKDICFEKTLQIKDIYWKYNDKVGNILKGVNITVNKGEAVGIIGESGSGKSTLVDVILGLLQPQQGKVLLDNRDVYTDLKGWSKLIGYVPQAVFLVDGSVRENVAFGLSAEEIDDKKIWVALEQAQLRKFVEALPDKLNTEVGERGVKFSGGQRQRIAIARALYYNPEILVLDEATSALDNETETAVMEAIETLQGKKTLLIVAHRLTTISKCDKVFEIRDGVAIQK